MQMPFRSCLILSMYFVIATTVNGNPTTMIFEAESFESHGGWKLDTQFIEEMDKQLDALASAEEKLTALNKHFNNTQI